jgi:hypothetical protein
LYGNDKKRMSVRKILGDAGNEELLAGFNNCRGNPVNGNFMNVRKKERKNYSKRGV